MTTALTSPAGGGARPSEAERGLPGPGPRSRRRRAIRWALAAAAVAVACLLVTSDLEARAQIPTAAASLQSIDRHLSGLRTELGRAQRRLAGARTRGQAVTRSFDSAQSALSATQATLSGDERGIHSQGVDLGALDTCLSDVEQALNQFAVGQTTGGLVSLRASSTACSVLDEVG